MPEIKTEKLEPATGRLPMYAYVAGGKYEIPERHQYELSTIEAGSPEWRAFVLLHGVRVESGREKLRRVHDAIFEPSETGGVKGRKRAQLGAIDPLALLALAEVAGMGTEKYDRYNYLKGYDWSLSFDALQRHALAFWAGEDLDPESGESHMAHVAWLALSLVAFAKRGIGTDDRFKGDRT